MNTAAKIEMLNTFNTREAELIRAASMLENVLLGQGHIVVCEGVYLTFEVENNIANKPHSCQPERCIRFTKRDAEDVAANVTNSRGTQAKAIHVRTAVEMELKGIRETIALISK